jgi:hypothetical protein
MPTTRNSPSAARPESCLGDELDVADAAGADLHVEGLAGGRPLLPDALLHLLDGRHAGQVHRGAVDHRTDVADDAPAEGQIARHRAGLHEGRLLPRGGPAVVVPGERVGRDHQRPLRASKYSL